MATKADVEVMAALTRALDIGDLVVHRDSPQHKALRAISETAGVYTSPLCKHGINTREMVCLACGEDKPRKVFGRRASLRGDFVFLYSQESRAKFFVGQMVGASIYENGMRPRDGFAQVQAIEKRGDAGMVGEHWGILLYKASYITGFADNDYLVEVG